MLASCSFEKANLQKYTEATRTETNILKPETSVSERLEGLIAELLAKLGI